MSILEKISRNTYQGWRYGFAVPLRHVSAFLGRKYHTIGAGKTRVRIRAKSSDVWTFVQVFHNREYDISGHGQFARVRAAYRRILDSGRVPLVIDAGANVGAAAIWFAQQFPEALVLAVEPDADNAALCRFNTKNFPRVKVVEAAIGSRPGPVSLSNPKNEAWAIRTVRSGEGKIAALTIPQLVADVQGPAGIFLVKIDIEGFEADLFADNIEWLDEAEVVMIEPHDWMLPGKGTSRNLQKAMGERNFEVLVSGENLVYVRLP